MPANRGTSTRAERKRAFKKERKQAFKEKRKAFNEQVEALRTSSEVVSDYITAKFEVLFDDRAVYCSCQKQTSYTFRGYVLRRDVTKFQGYTLLAV